MDQEKIFANDDTNKGSIFKIYKQLIQLKRYQKIVQSKDEKRTQIDISAKKTYIWPIGTGKDVQYHYQKNANQNCNKILPHISQNRHHQKV